MKVCAALSLKAFSSARNLGGIPLCIINQKYIWRNDITIPISFPRPKLERREYAKQLFCYQHSARAGKVSLRAINSEREQHRAFLDKIDVSGWKTFLWVRLRRKKGRVCFILVLIAGFHWRSTCVRLITNLENELFDSCRYVCLRRAIR